MPKVLISDALSPAAVQIFKDRGIEVDFQPSLGKDKEKLAELIGNYDGLAIRSATKVTAEDPGKGQEPEGDRPRRHRRRQCRYPGGDRARHHRDEHAVRQFDHHRRARHLADAGAGAPNPGGRRLDARRQMGKEQVHGRRDLRQDARRHRLRQYRLDRRRPRPRPEDEGDRLRSVPVAGARDRSRRREGRTRRAVQARRFHHAAHAAHRQDPQHHRRRRHREDEEGRAHHQLRARRAGRRGGAWPKRSSRARSPAPPSTSSSRSRRRKVRCSACPTWCARRISAPPPRKRRKTSRCRSPSRCRTICCAARSPTRSTSPRSPPRRRRELKPFVALAEKLGSFAGQLTENPDQGKCRSPTKARWRR